jgi:hypothetical protein
VVIVALAVGGAASCRRPLGEDDGGTLPVHDAGFFDVPIAEALTDVALPDLPRPDVPRPDAGGDAGDAGRDMIPGATCPADVTPVDVCGCGCCGEAKGRACYYPALGESRETVPHPPPSNCATAGCSAGVRHLCCADPGPRPGVVTLCANNTSDEDFPRYQVTRRDNGVCTSLEVAISAPGSPIVGPGLSNVATAWREPCGDISMRKYAIGGLGRVTESPLTHADGSARRDIHVALYFDSGTGIADVVRIDADDVNTWATCLNSNDCPVCGGTCAFDAMYEYGYVGGGPALWHDRAILEPPASFKHVRTPTTPMPAILACAPALPSCGGAEIDAGDVMAALADPDVQTALERSKSNGIIQLYGTMPRVPDASMFELTRAGGGGFMIGDPCPPGVGGPTCPVPGGLSRLMLVLTALDEQQVADPACVNLRP